VHSKKPTETGTRPSTSLFINSLVFAKDHDDEAVPFSEWPAGGDALW